MDPNNRLVYLGSGTSAGGVSYPDFEDWRTQATSFEGMAAVRHGGLRLRLGDERGVPDTYDGTELSTNAFHVLGQRPLLGRDFAAADAAPGAAPVTILSYGLWARRYAKASGIVGQTVRLNGVPTTVIGIMPRGFDFPHHRVDVWVPLVPHADLQPRQHRILWFVFGRMAEGATIESAAAEMNAIGHGLANAYPLTNQGVFPVLMNFAQFFIGPNAVLVYGTLWGAVGCVLLIACANLASLLIARAMSRFREIAVRIALGAGRWRLTRQLLIESVMLSAMGGVVGWAIATWSVRTYALVASPPSSYTRWENTMDARVFAYLWVISIGAGMLFGLAPARQVSRVDVNAALKDGGGRTTAGGHGTRASTRLVIGEMALAVVLLTAAGIMTRSFLNIYTANLGVSTANLLTASVELPVTRYPNAEQRHGFFEQLTEGLAAIPGIESIALANGLPGFYAPHRPYELEGAPSVNAQRRPTVSTLTISPGYFRTVGASVLAGRSFKDADDVAGAPSVIVNQRFARTFWPGQDALGKRLRFFTGDAPLAWLTIVGVVSNIVQNDRTGQTFDPVVYVPFRQDDAGTGIVIARTGVPPEGLGRVFRHEIQTLDPDLEIGSGYGSIEGPKSLGESLAFHYWSDGLNGALFLAFAAIALVLASLGLYAVVSHAVGQRTQEIGIRLALGATTRDILTLVFTQGMRPVGLGLVIGLAAALAVTPLLKTQLVGVSPADPFTLVVAPATLVMAGTLGCLIPARRAMRVDPVVALRHE